MGIPDVARHQAGQFTYRQARTDGWSGRQIRQRIASGRWIVILHGVLAASGHPVDRSARTRAAQLVTGGVVSHLTAALLWGLPVRDDGRLHVTVPPSVRVRHREVVVHRLPLDDDDVGCIDGMPVTSRARTMLDCLATLPEPQARRFLDQLLLMRLLDLVVLAYLVSGAVGRRGAPQLVRLMRAATQGSRSEAERVLHLILRRARIRGWQANVAVHDGAELVAIVDVLFEGARLVIEVDGRAWHTDNRRFQHDRTRQNRLVGLGYTVLRFTWEDLTRRPDYVADTVRTTLARLRTAGAAAS